MDEKIEEMAKAIEYAINNDCKLNNGKSCEDCIFDNNGDWNCQNKLVATHLFGEKYRKESDTARECLEQFICRLVNARIVGVNDDLYYELLETKDDLLKEKYGVDLGE